MSLHAACRGPSVPDHPPDAERRIRLPMATTPRRARDSPHPSKRPKASSHRVIPSAGEARRLAPRLAFIGGSAPSRETRMGKALKSFTRCLALLPRPLRARPCRRNESIWVLRMITVVEIFLSVAPRSDSLEP